MAKNFSPASEYGDKSKSKRSADHKISPNEKDLHFLRVFAS